MTITKAQWAGIEANLSFSYGRVNFKADGYELTAAVEPVGTLKQGIVIYVNGVWKGEWMRGGCPEADKFMRESRRWLWSAKQREDAKKKMKSRHLDASLRDWYKKTAESYVSTWSPIWNTPASFTRNLRKTCKDIELVSIGYES